MKEFWVKDSDKEAFSECVSTCRMCELPEKPDSCFRMTEIVNWVNVTKYYYYRVDMTEEEYLFLKLQFDLKEEV